MLFLQHELINNLFIFSFVSIRWEMEQYWNIFSVENFNGWIKYDEVKKKKNNNRSVHSLYKIDYRIHFKIMIVKLRIKLRALYIKFIIDIEYIPKLLFN